MTVSRNCHRCEPSAERLRFAIDPAGPVDWGDLAGGAGYVDQAHFGHEFRAFTGLAPTRYVMDGWPIDFLQERRLATR